MERISRDCFKDGGALAEVMNFYGSKGDQDLSHSKSFTEGDIPSEEEKVDPGLEVENTGSIAQTTELLILMAICLCNRLACE